MLCDKEDARTLGIVQKLKYHDAHEDEYHQHHELSGVVGMYARASSSAAEREGEQQLRWPGAAGDDPG